jgi:hypothetical protein
MPALGVLVRPFQFLDLDHQFTTFRDCCDDPEVDLPSENDMRWSLLIVATVSQGEFLLERTVSLLPGPQSAIPGQALRFFKAQRSTEPSRKIRRRFAHFRPLENRLLRVAAEFDKLLPGIIANIETSPRRQLCGSISLSFLVKMAEFIADFRLTPRHEVLIVFIREQKINANHAPRRWRSMLRLELLFIDGHTPLSQTAGDAASQASPLVLPIITGLQSDNPIPTPARHACPMLILRHSESNAAHRGMRRRKHSPRIIAMANLRTIAESRLVPILNNAAQFTFVVLTQDGQFTAQEQILAFLNIVVPGKTAF